MKIKSIICHKLDKQITDIKFKNDSKNRELIITLKYDNNSSHTYFREY